MKPRRITAPLMLPLDANELDLADLALPIRTGEALQQLGRQWLVQLAGKALRPYGPNPLRSAQVLFVGGAFVDRVLAAYLLARDLGTRVMMVSSSALRGRYIGETEKNIDALFASITKKGRVLFFDEADALFGKRTSVQSGHSRYANQEVSYLLQRAQGYRGLVILSTAAGPALSAVHSDALEAVVDFGDD